MVLLRQFATLQSQLVSQGHAAFDLVSGQRGKLFSVARTSVAERLNATINPLPVPRFG